MDLTPKKLLNSDTNCFICSDANRVIKEQAQLTNKLLAINVNVYATLDNKTPAETFPKFPSVLRVIDRWDRNPPIAAR